MSNSQPPTQCYTPGVPQQTQPVLQAANTSYQSTVPKRNARKIPGAKFFGIFTIIIAFLLSTLGIVAIIIKAKDSYVGDPIWTAVLFILPAGALGLLSYLKRNSLCSNVSYLIMNIFACVMSAHLVIYASINAMRERSWYSSSDYNCNPWPGFDYIDYEANCQFPLSGRVTVDSLIAVLAFIQFILSVISLAFTCYGTWTCCYNCCRSAPPPAVMQYTAQNGACQLMSIGAYQTPIAYQPVNLLVPAGQPGQVVSPNTAVAPGKFNFQQPVYMPASPNQVPLIQQPQPMAASPGSFVNQPMPASPNQVALIQQPQPMAATPGSFVSQPMPASSGSVVNPPALTAPTPMAATPGSFINQPMVATPGSFINQSMTATPGSFVSPQGPTAPTANGGTVTVSTDTKPETQSETSQPLHEPPNVAYCQTSSEQFHDKRNLLDSV